jgi:transcriptional regulator with XRE-family HTH domain
LKAGDIHITVGKNVREWRKKMSLSQETLAERADLSVSYISKMERGIISPSIGTLYEIARVLNVPAFMLLAEKEDETTDVCEIQSLLTRMSKKRIRLIRKIVKTLAEEDKLR